MWRSSGFSLTEVLVATGITAGIAAAAFQLFHQNERILHDQVLLLEMQQSARVVAAEIADDVRLAGQGVPEGGAEIVLQGSGSSRINLRAGYGGVQSVVTLPAAPILTVGTPAVLTVESPAGFTNGRHVFVWEPDNWVRAVVNGVSTAARTLQVTPVEGSASAVTLRTSPAVSLDEAIAVYFDAATGAVKRTTATSTANSAVPVWSAANDLALHVAGLTFAYFDAAGQAVLPDTAMQRSLVARIEARILVRASAPLRDRSRPVYALSIRAAPRSLRSR